MLGDGPLYEIVNGQRVDLPEPSAYAGWVRSRLQVYMGRFAASHQIGTVLGVGLFLLDAQRQICRRPAVAFVSAQRWPLERRLPDSDEWEVIPNLVVEMIDPNARFQDVIARISEYFQVGVEQVWLLLLAQKRVQIYDSPTSAHILTEADELDGGALLPGFHLPVAMVFER